MEDLQVDTTPAAEADDIREVIAALLTTSRLLVAIGARSLAALDETLTLPQYRMLVALDEHGSRSLVRLAEHLKVNSSTALRMVDRLAAVGLLEKIANPDDRRQVLLRLTGPGRLAVWHVATHRRAEITRAVRAIPALQRRPLISALHAFMTAVDGPTTLLPDLPGWQ